MHYSINIIEKTDFVLNLNFITHLLWEGILV